MNNNIYYEKGSIHKDNHQETHIKINGNVSAEMFEKIVTSFFGENNQKNDTKKDNEE